MTVTRIVMAGLLAAALSVMSILAALPAHAADAVSVKAEELQGFARLRFQWPDAVTVDAQESNGVVVLKFGRAFDAALNDLPIQLPNYVALARQDADGSTLRLALKFPFRVEALTAANEVYVNLIPENSQRAFPGLPPEVLQREQAARAAAEKAAAAKKALALVELPDVPVRVGVHNSYSRIVFDWPDDIDYKVSRDGSRLDLEFSAPGHLKIGRLRVDPPPFVTDAETDTDSTNAKLRLTISPEAEFRMFREPTGIVLDLTAASEDAGALAALELNQDQFAGVLPSDAADAGSRNAATPVPVEPAPSANTPANEEASKEAVTMIDPRRIGRPDTARIVKDSGYAEERAADAGNPSSAATMADAVQGAAEDVALDGTTDKVNVAAPDTGGDTLSVETPRIVKPSGENIADTQNPVLEPTDAASTDVAVAEETVPVVPSEPAGSVKVRRRGDTVTFSFAGLVDAPAAVFERAGHVWALFETDVAIDKPVLTEEHVRFVDAAEIVEADGLHGVRLRLASDALVTAQLEGETWSVAIGETVLRPPGPLAIRRGVQADGGGKLFAIAPDAAATRRITDPQVGDTLAIVPLPGPVRGVVSPRETVDLEVLASAHGLIFRPIADDVVISLNNQGQVAASRRAGLVLTANPRRPAAAELNRQNNIFAPGVVGFRLASGDPDDYLPGLAALNSAVANATTPDERKDARLALVRFYLGYEYGTEALGLMRLMAEARKDQTSDPEFIMLRGIASYMIGRYDDAMADLSSAALKYDPNAAVWRTLANVRLGQFADARSDVTRARTVISDYAPSVQARFHLAAASVSLGVNDIANVESDLRKVPDDGLDHALFAERTLLAGQLAQANGNPEEALSRFAQAVALDYRPIAARATLLQAGLLRALDANGEVVTVAAVEPAEGSEDQEAAEGEAEAAAVVASLDEAINTLDRLRFTWRGGDVELDAVAELAKIYEQQGDYRSALSVMRTVATQFPSAEKGREIADQMVAMFRRLFLDGEVDSLKPLEALSLFYDFRELTPVGRDGDRMIRELADRLVAVDLLDQAAEMLEHQVTHRLRGVARAQVAGRLAAVHLLNSEPGEALSALRKTRQAQLPQQVADERLLFEAKALSALGRHDHALELLADNRSDPARALTADVYWEAGMYAESGRALEDLLGLAWTRDVPLTSDEQFDVLRSAISYVLARESDGVERIRQKYSEKMAQGPQAAAFSIVASSSDGRGIAFRDLAREIAQVDTLDRFMNGYRGRYEAGQAGEGVIN
ncbi:MAG: hypothetical protein R8J41_02905 [Alphaproteobacteria bacterium]|nr:hypothetical protein [Alphaproteobacteria bacterium]